MAARWKDWELDYLYNHAGDGAQSIAEKLGRTKAAVEVMASRERISLTRRWRCPRCGRTTYTPLVQWSGWCRRCTISETRDTAALVNRKARLELKREEEGIDELERERGALYVDTNKTRKKLRRFHES